MYKKAVSRIVPTVWLLTAYIFKKWLRWQVIPTSGKHPFNTWTHAINKWICSFLIDRKWHVQLEPCLSDCFSIIMDHTGPKTAWTNHKLQRQMSITDSHSALPPTQGNDCSRIQSHEDWFLSWDFKTEWIGVLHFGLIPI